MSLPTYSVPQVGQPNSTEDVDIATALSQIYTILNGAVEAANIAAATITAAKMASEAWTPYTPTVTTVTLGSGGVMTSQYMKLGRTVHLQGRITLGTGGSFTGSDVTITLPAVAASAQAQIGSVTAWDNSLTTRYTGLLVIAASASSFTCRWQGTSDIALGATSPFTWNVSDHLAWTVTYEAAS